MEVLDKLHSYDADIRYMGLSDMQRAINVQGIESAWPPAVVSLLGDASPDVQNLAVRVLGQLASVDADKLVRLVLESNAAVNIRAVALKNVIQQSRILPRDSVQLVLTKLLRDPIFSTVEGSEAMIELLNRVVRQPSFSDRLSELLSYAANLVSHPGLLRMRGFEMLALVVPAVPAEEWNGSVKLSVVNSVAKIHDPAAMALVGRLAHNVPSDWLIPELEDIVYTFAENPDDVDTCEAALETLSVLYTVDGFNQPRADALARRHIWYRGLDADDDFSGASDDDMERDDDSEDSDWFDESSRVRRAAAKLASRSSDPEMARTVFSSALSEVDESTRSTMYTALAEMPAVSELHLSLEKLVQRISKDIVKGNWSAVDAGIRMVATWGLQDVVAKLVHEAAAKRPALLNRYVFLIHGPVNTEDTRWIVKRALDPDVAAVPDTAIYTLKLATDLGESQVALDAARLTRSTCHSEPLKIAALNASGRLATPADWPEIIPLALHNLRAEPALRPAALNCLKRAATSPISTEDAQSIVFSVAEILNVCEEPIIDAKCCEVLASLPDTVAPEIVHTVLNLKNTDHQDKKAVILMSKARASQPGVLEWAVATEALELLQFLALEVGDKKHVLNVALEHSNVPEVHAYASGYNWRSLDEHYKFTTTAFSALSTEQLRVLLALAKNDVKWDWYTVQTMLESSLDENDALKGAVLGLMAIILEAENVFISQMPRLKDEVLTASFEAYSSRTRNKQVIFNLALEHPRLRIPSALARAVTTHSDLETFLGNFRDQVDTSVATIKLLRGAVLVESLPTLIEYVSNTAINSGSRADACMTVSWILQTAETEHVEQYVDQALLSFASALEPLRDQVQTVNIGPFKHRVDLNLPLRQASIDGIYTCVSQSKLSSYREIVDAIVDHGLRDELEVKIVACRVLPILAGLDRGAVQERRHTIHELWDEEWSRKLKDSATKEDVEKHTTLLNAIQSARETLSSK